MKKKFAVVAVATSLVLVNGATSAFAAKVSNETTTTSTTVPATQGKSKGPGAQNASDKAAKQRQAYKAELAKYLETRKAINTAFKTAMSDAQKAFKTAHKSATTNQARLAAAKAFRSAVSAATKTKTAALKALGAPQKSVQP